LDEGRPSAWSSTPRGAGMVFRRRADTGHHGPARPGRRDGWRGAAAVASRGPERPPCRRAPSPARCGETGHAGRVPAGSAEHAGRRHRRAGLGRSGATCRAVPANCLRCGLPSTRLRRRPPPASLGHDLRTAAAASGIDVLGAATE
jgi:hypothetical protein